MAESLNLILASLNQVWVLIIVPKIIVALFIWIIGKYLINLGVTLVGKIDIKGTKIDDYLIGVFSKVVLVVGKVLLFLVILDFLGVGRTIIGAVTNGLTLMVAIAFGLAFGRALEEDAKEMVRQFKEHLGKK